LAGGLALRLAEPPPGPKPEPALQVPEIAVPVPVPAPAVRWKAAPPPEVVASAPPAVYTTPAAPLPVKRKPFPEPVRVAKADPPPKPVPYQEPPSPARHVTLETGMTITVRLERKDVLQGILEQPVIAEGLEVAERGAKVSVRAEGENRVRLLSFQSADGQRIDISTDPTAVDGDVVRFRLAARRTITERRL